MTRSFFQRSYVFYEHSEYLSSDGNSQKKPYESVAPLQHVLRVPAPERGVNEAHLKTED